MQKLPIFALALVTTSLGCGGALEDGDANRRPNDDDGTATTTKADPLEKLRARCAEPWKNNFASDVQPSRTLAEGRWLRCPGDTIASGKPYVIAFDGLELTADKRFFRLTTGPNGFERSTNELGDSGKWEMRQDGELWFELPPCSAGYVKTPNGQTCGGLDPATPLFEASPTRMRFYGAAHWYVKEE